MSDILISIEVAYALPDQQWLIPLQLTPPVTAEQAVQASGLLELIPDLARDELTVGIFGTVCASSTELNSGDRVEIYRPLIYDPKVARRIRAAK